MYGNQLRAHAKMMAAVSCSCVPLVSFIIGNAVGPTSYCMVGSLMCLEQKAYSCNQFFLLFFKEGSGVLKIIFNSLRPPPQTNRRKINQHSTPPRLVLMNDILQIDFSKGKSTALWHSSVFYRHTDPWVQTSSFAGPMLCSVWITLKKSHRASFRCGKRCIEQFCTRIIHAELLKTLKWEFYAITAY